VRSTDVAQIDFVRSTLSNAVVNDYDSWATRRTYTAALSYVTGAHAFKAGVQFGEGPYRETYFINQDMHLRFQSGVPDSVDVWNTPVDVRENMNADLGVYAQDSWTMRRLTVNAGVRFEHFNTSIEEQTAPAGRFVPERRFAAIKDVPNWTTLVPRIGLAYDLFGDGKTALKVSASQYMANEGVGLAHRVNPMFLSFDRRSWTDLNSDGEAQVSELGASTGFRGGVNQRIDPEMQRPYNWEYVASVQQEILPRFSLTAAYYRRNIRRLYGVKNLLVSPRDYTLVMITNPLTNEPLTVYNQNPATRGQVDLLLSNRDELNRTYNGFELKLDKRFANSATLFGGITIGRKFGSIRGFNDDLNNPNVLVNHEAYVDLDSTYQYKLAGAYPLPLGVTVSAALQSNTGQPLRRVFNVTRALVPNLTQVSQAVDLLPRGHVRLDRMNLLDLRLTKRFHAGGVRLEGVADVYNVLNSDVPVAEVETVGGSLARPVSILDGRLLRLGLKLNF
jgi:hypothetical protein